MKFKPKSQDSRSFVKLQDKETITGVFRGDIYEFRTHWHERRSVLCSKENCELCQAGDKPRFRFRVNFITKDGDSYAAKVIEQGWNFYDVLRTLNDGDYPLEKYIMKITRQGSGLHTSYTVIPAPNGIVTTDLEQKISQVKLNDLGHLTETETEGPELHAALDREISEIPF